jgi:uncharacterized protein
MHIGAIRIVLLLAGSRSLKDKRRTVKALKDRLHNTFNVSAAEVEDQDLLQKAVLGVAVAGADTAHVRSVCDSVAEFVRREYGGCLASVEMEMR